MNKPFGHFKTITTHRHEVIKNCFKAGIGFQGLKHDLSKYSPDEFLQGAKYWVGNRSPNEIERELYGYSKAWLHHKGRNKHHFEYWTDYNPKFKKVMPVQMPRKYVVEMFCDRVGACKIYNGISYKNSDPFDYYAKGRDKRLIHPQTDTEIEMLLSMLKEKGEKETFSYIKNVYLKNK